MQVFQHTRERQRIGLVVLQCAPSLAAHPVDISAGAEALAGAAQEHHAHVVGAFQRLEMLGQIGDHQFVERVVLIGPVERDHGDALGRHIEQHRIGGERHGAAPSTRSSACGRSASGVSNRFKLCTPAKKYSKSSGGSACSMYTGANLLR